MAEQSKVRSISSAMEKRLASGKNKNKFLFANYREEIENYQEGVELAKKLFFPLLFACAIASDCADFIPIAGTIIKIFALAIIWYNFYIKTKVSGYLDDTYKIQVSWRVRLFFRLLGIVDIIPFINALPLTTLSVFIVWMKVRQMIQKNEKEIVALEQKEESSASEEKTEEELSAAKEKTEGAAYKGNPWFGKMGSLPNSNLAKETD